MVCQFFISKIIKIWSKTVTEHEYIISNSSKLIKNENKFIVFQNMIFPQF